MWEALGFSPEETASLEIRSDIMLQIRELVRSRKWTQRVAATRCGITQPRMSDLLRGRIDKFSLDALVNIAAKLGLKMHVTIKAA